MPHPPPLPLPFQTDLHRMRETIALRPFWAESILSNAAFGRSSVSYDQPTLNDMIMNGWSERCILLGIFLTKYDICKILSINIYLSSAWSVNWWWSLVRFTKRLRFAFKDRLRQLEKSRPGVVYDKNKEWNISKVKRRSVKKWISQIIDKSQNFVHCPRTIPFTIKAPEPVVSQVTFLVFSIVHPYWLSFASFIIAGIGPSKYIYIRWGTISIAS